MFLYSLPKKKAIAKPITNVMALDPITPKLNAGIPLLISTTNGDAITKPRIPQKVSVSCFVNNISINLATAKIPITTPIPNGTKIAQQVKIPAILRLNALFIKAVIVVIIG